MDVLYEDGPNVLSLYLLNLSKALEPYLYNAPQYDAVTFCPFINKHTEFLEVSPKKTEESKPLQSRIHGRAAVLVLRLLLAEMTHWIFELFVILAEGQAVISLLMACVGPLIVIDNVKTYPSLGKYADTRLVSNDTVENHPSC